MVDLVVTTQITNCLDCTHVYTEVIPTSDSFEHESGAYCNLCEDTSQGRFGQNGRHRLIGTDDWNLRACTKIPEWCPLLSDDQKAQIDKENQLKAEMMAKAAAKYKEYLLKFAEHVMEDAASIPPMSFEEYQKSSFRGKW